MKNIGRWIALAVAGVAAAVILVTLTGVFLTPVITAHASVEIARPQAEVFHFLSNVENLPQWSSEVKTVRKLSSHPLKYQIGGSAGEMETEILTLDPPHRYTTRMGSPGASFSGEWEITVEPAGSGCRVTSDARIRIGNPFFRGLALFLNGNKAEEATLLELKRHMEARPR